MLFRNSGYAGALTLQNRLRSASRCVVWQGFSGFSSRMRGSSFGRFSFPIQVSSSLGLALRPLTKGTFWFSRPSIRACV